MINPDDLLDASDEELRAAAGVIGFDGSVAEFKAYLVRWQRRQQELEEKARKRAEEQQHPRSKYHRPWRDHVDEDEIEHYDKQRWHFFDKMNKSSSWTKEDITLEIVRRGGERYSVGCLECGNRRDDPDKFCVHRAYFLRLKLAQSGKQHAYDGIPSDWGFTYDDWKENGNSFDWELAFP